jgi:hypothetical protein
VITGGFGSNEPALLIRLLGEIPELVEGTDNQLKVGVGAIKVDRVGEPCRQSERQRLERMIEERGAS